MISQPTPAKPAKKAADNDSKPIANRRPTRAAKAKAQQKKLADSEDEGSQVHTRSRRRPNEEETTVEKPVAGRAGFKGKARPKKRQLKALRKESRVTEQEEEPEEVQAEEVEVSEVSEAEEPEEVEPVVSDKESEPIRQPKMPDLAALARAVQKEGLAPEEGLKKKDGIWKKITMSILNILSTEDA